MTILTHIQQLLDQNDFPSTLREASDEAPYDRLIVALESPIPNQENLLEIVAHPQSFEGELTRNKAQDSYYLIQFQYVLPAEISPDTFNQLSSCLHFFNRLLPCPGFELDELSDQIVYRYVWFIKKNGIDAFLVKQVIGNMQLCYNLFSPYINEIAEGKYTLQDILEKVIELTQQKPQANG